MTFLLQVIIGIFVLGILVLIHELGHFTVAKACGIRVLAFSIGFGKPLIAKTIGTTEYRISSIPFGGYVHMAGEHPEDNHAGADDEFMSKPIWQRASVALAGPAANILFSIIFLWIFFMKGVPHPLYLDTPLIGNVTEYTPASTAGILPGDSIITINGTTVQSWEDIKYHFTLQEESYTITLIRKKEERTYTLKHKSFNAEELFKAPYLGLEPPYPAKIGTVIPGSQAEKYGIKTDDHIIAIDNKTIFSWGQFSSLTANYNPYYGSMQIVINRGDSICVLSAKPKYSEQEKRYMLGVGPAPAPKRTIQYSPIGAIPKTFEKSWGYTTMVFKIVPKLPKILLKVFTKPMTPQGIAGPVGIVQISGIIAFGGLLGLLDFMALIGINLGILNLFPLIITDGGMLFFLLIEAFRKKPLSLKTQLLLNRIAIAFFITLFVFITFNDIIRMFQFHKLLGK